MGTMVQGLGLADEAAWRGERLKDHEMSVRGCTDVLVLSQPAAIEGIHHAFLRAGADIVETDTFTATSVGLADYGLEGLVPRDQRRRRAVRPARRGSRRA